MIEAISGLALGSLLGMAHLVLLRVHARLYVASGSWRKTAFLGIARLAVIGGGFWLIAQLGAVMLLGALAGFFLARTAILARMAFGHG